MNLHSPVKHRLTQRSMWAGLIFLTTALGNSPLLAQNSGAPIEAPPETVRRSPAIRYEALALAALPSLSSHLIAPFLVEPLVLDAPALQHAPRIVATEDGRVLLTRGDRAYARGPIELPLLDEPGQTQKIFQIFREATPLKDPLSGEILGYEAQLLGRAVLTSSESTQAVSESGSRQMALIPATVEILGAREEIRVGDRLLPEPPPALFSDLPLTPGGLVDARILSVYGSAVMNAGQSQVVALNRGTRDGLARGHLLAILKDGPRLIDPTDAKRTLMKLPDERNGFLLVFRTFEKLSYGLVMAITDGVKVGDRLVNPR